MTTTTITPGDDEDVPKGFAQMPRWLQRDPDVSAAAKLVYLALSSRAGQAGESVPAHKRLAAEASCSIPSVKRALKELRDLGVVEWTKRARPDSGQTSNEYRISIARRPVDKSSSEDVPPPAHTDPPPNSDLPPSSHRATNESQVNEEQTINQSSGLTLVDGAVDNSGDDDRKSPTGHHPSPADVRARRRELDVIAIFTATGRIFADVEIGDAGMLRLAQVILGRASAPVINPTQYVIRAILNAPHEWQREAFALDEETAARGGNPF